VNLLLLIVVKVGDGKRVVVYAFMGGLIAEMVSI
jgi:hypothetical protein